MSSQSSHIDFSLGQRHKSQETHSGPGCAPYKQKNILNKISERGALLTINAPANHSVHRCFRFSELPVRTRNIRQQTADASHRREQWNSKLQNHFNSLHRIIKFIQRGKRIHFAKIRNGARASRVMSEERRHAFVVFNPQWLRMWNVYAAGGNAAAGKFISIFVQLNESASPSPPPVSPCLTSFMHETPE